MAAEDYFDPYGEPDEDEGSITCKYCGAQDLHWEEGFTTSRGLRWVLIEENDSIHCCTHGPQPAASADEFPIETEDT